MAPLYLNPALDRCVQQNHQTGKYYVKRHHVYIGTSIAVLLY
jgi:hypothetical protein